MTAGRKRHGQEGRRADPQRADPRRSGPRRADPTHAPDDLLHAYVQAHNVGARTGDFGPLLALLSADAEMWFHGLAVGPFIGRAAIAQAFATRQPDDELILLTRSSGAPGSAAYAWSRAPEIAAGRLALTVLEYRIQRIDVYSGADLRAQ